MKINENYNSASQKYGINIVKELTSLGLPPQFLLSACRFHTEINVPLRTLVFQFKEWLKYVLKYNRQYDVNKLSYDDFSRTISIEKGKHCVPNVVYKDDLATLGRLDNANDVKCIPVKNQWCIKSQIKFDNYKNQGYVFYVIYLSSEPLPFTYVIAAIFRGNVQYYNTEDYEQWEDLRKDGDVENSDHEIYQRKLPRGLVIYLYNIAANQTEQIENNKDINENNMKRNRKQVMRLTESDLHKVIKESVKRVLNEIGDTPKGQYALGALASRKNNGLAPSSDGFDRSIDHYASKQRKQKLGHDVSYVPTDNPNLDYLNNINPMRDSYDLGFRDYKDYDGKLPNRFH